MPEIYAIAVEFEEKASPPNHLKRDQVFVFIFVFIFFLYLYLWNLKRKRLLPGSFEERSSGSKKAPHGLRRAIEKARYVDRCLLWSSAAVVCNVSQPPRDKCLPKVSQAVARYGACLQRQKATMSRVTRECKRCFERCFRRDDKPKAILHNG